MVAKAIAVVTIGPLDKPADMATAFPIGEEFVIAPRHVVFDKESDSLFDEIEISWVRVVHKGQDEEYEKFGCTEKVEVGVDLGELADLVLLRCEIPTEFHNYFYLSEIFPETHDRWETFGYAKVRADPNNLEQTPAHGNFNAVDDQRSRLTLKYEAGPLDIREWGGMSGAPICRGRCVLAVVLQVENPRRSKGTFYAVPMAWLLKPERYPEFRDLVCLPPDQKILDSAEQLLSRSHVVCQFLEDATKNSGHEFKNLRQGVEVLARISIANLVSIIREAQSKLMEKNRAGALVLGEFLSTLLPIKLDDPLAARIRQGKKEGKIGVIRMNSHATTVSAEMLMARADLRAACFRLEFIDARAKKGDKYLVPSENALELPPESGDSSSHTRKNIAIDIHQRYGGDASLARIEVSGHLYRTKVPPIGPEPDDMEQVIELVNDELQGRIRRGDPVLYLLVSYKSGNDHATGTDDWLGAMSKSFPSLGFVVLAGPYKERRMEHQAYQQLPLIDGFAGD